MSDDGLIIGMWLGVMVAYLFDNDNGNLSVGLVWGAGMALLGLHIKRWSDAKK